VYPLFGVYFPSQLQGAPCTGSFRAGKPDQKSQMTIYPSWVRNSAQFERVGRGPGVNE
jgi:hypothetical protein